MKLTKRLQAVLDMVPHCKAVADVGTDHGFLAAALIQTGVAEHVIAIDVNKGPLASAKKLITDVLLTDRVECRLGDGLTVTKQGEIEGAVLCGMGGFLMRDIIAAGPEKLNFYLVQPQNGQAELRQYLYEQGYVIIREALVKDMSKYYTPILACRYRYLESYVDNPQSFKDVYASLSADDIRWSIGALLAAEKSPLWETYVENLIYVREKALKGLAKSETDVEREKVTQLKREISALTTLK